MPLPHHRHGGHQCRYRERAGCNGEVRGYQGRCLRSRASVWPLKIGSDCCTIYIAEAAGLALFGVMKTTCPVDCNVTFAAIQSCSTLHTATCTDAAKFEKTIKDWAVVTHVETALLFLVGLHVVGCHFFEKIDVLIRVELGHLKIGGRFGALCSKSASCTWWQ